MVVRADNRAYGEKACQFLGTKLGGKGKVVMLQGGLASINGRDRTEAFNDCMKKNYPGIKVFGEATNWTARVAASKLQTPLTANPDIKGVYMQSSFALAGTLQVLKQKGLLVAADGSEARLRRLQRRHPGGAEGHRRAGRSTRPSPSPPTSTPSTPCTTSRRRSRGGHPPSSLRPCERKSSPPATVNATTTPPLCVRPRATPDRTAVWASGLSSGRIGGANSIGSSSSSLSRR